MMTSYLVKCPHVNCDWFGSLLPRGDSTLWVSALPTTTMAVFECPRCRREWKARVHGDDIQPLPLEESAEVCV